MTLDTVPAAASEPLNLLLIEDDDGDAKAVQRAFRTAKVRNTITRAHDGMEALQLLRGGEGGSVLQAPYILLVDINMPRLDGFQFADAYHALYPELKGHARLFVCSSSINPADRQRTDDHPVIDGFCEKPVTRGVLGELL